jgi:hypothetical protein
MRNWSEVDLSKVDLATLSAEDRHGLYAEVERRARRERTRALREVFAWLRRSLGHPQRRRGCSQVYVPVPRGPLDLIFGGRA